MLFQIGDLVKYNSDNRWVSQRGEMRDNVGVIVEITTFKNDTSQNEVHVKWNIGDKKVYFQEELTLLSEGKNEKQLN